MSLSQDLLNKLPFTTIGTLISVLLAAKDPDGKPAESVEAEMDLTDGETIVVSARRVGCQCKADDRRDETTKDGRAWCGTCFKRVF